MKKVAWVAILWLMVSLLVTGCSRDTKEETEEEELVNLDIRVALSDVASSRSQFEIEDAMPENDNEKMQTLRVIVVRENGVVEKNSLINLKAAAIEYEHEPIQVVSREKKWIYLFVNEKNTKVKRENETELLALNTYLNSIKEGKDFPTSEISSLIIHLDNARQQLEGALPMNECHCINVGKKDSSYNLFVTRAAVKFSFRITNNGTSDSKLTDVKINKMASREYYLPRNATYKDEKIAGKTYRAITNYDVPANLNYYTHEKRYDTPIPLPGKKGGSEPKEIRLPPIYLLEGKYEEEEKYSISIKVNGAELTGTLPNLPYRLPRNTHVVVNIKLNDLHLESITVDVEPYREVILDPDFGF